MKQRQAVGILADLVRGGGKRADVQIRREARYAKSSKAVDPKGRKARGEHGDPTMKLALRRKQAGPNSRTRSRNGL